MNEDKIRCWQSQAEAVRLTGVSRRTIKEWIDNKSIEQNKAGYVDIVEIFQRDVARKKKEIDRLKDKPDNPENPNHRLLLAKCRTEEAQAGLKELELQKLRGEVIDFEQAESEFNTAVLTTRSRILAVPSRLALPLSPALDPKQVAAKISDALHEALEELSVGFIDAGRQQQKEKSE